MTGYTLTVPEEVYRRVQQIARATVQPVEVVLLEYLQRLAEAVPVLAAEEEVELQALRYLSDDALWAMTREQMAAEAQARLQTLMDKNSKGEITPAEHRELARLVERGQQLMLRKSEAAAILFQRGYTVRPQDSGTRE
jgi:hypothetical protein